MFKETLMPEKNPQLSALQASFANEFDDEPEAVITESNQAKIETIEYLEATDSDTENTPAINLPTVQIEVSDVALYHKTPEVLVDKIKQQAGTLVFDMSTTKGRDACRSHAATIIRCITPALNASKALSEEAKKIQQADLNFRTKFENGVRAIAENVRKPLTEFELEQKRLEQKRLRLEAEALEQERLAKQYQTDWDAALADNELFDFRKEKAAREAVELAEHQAKEKAEYEQKLKDQAIEKERVRIEAEQREREAAQQREIERLEKERLQAIEREAKAEQDRINAEIKAQRDAELREQAAIENERKRAEQEAKKKYDEQARIDAEEKKKQMDLTHRGAVNNQIYIKLMGLGVTDEQAKNIIRAAVRHELGALVVNY